MQNIKIKDQHVSPYSHAAGAFPFDPEEEQPENNNNKRSKLQKLSEFPSTHIPYPGDPINPSGDPIHPESYNTGGYHQP